MKKEKLMFHFILPNLIVLLIPFCIALTCILLTFHSVKKDTLELSENISQQVQTQIDNVLLSSRDAGFALMQNRYIRYASVLSDPLSDPYVDPNLIVAQVTTSRPQNRLIRYCYVIFNKSQLVFFPGSYTQLDSFYNYVCRESDISLDDWLKERYLPNPKNSAILAQQYLPARDVVFGTGVDSIIANCIPYKLSSECLSLPYIDQSENPNRIQIQSCSMPNITVVYLLDVEEISKMIEQSLPHNIGTYEVFEPDGRLVCSHDPNYSTSSHKDVCISLVSDQTGWTYNMHISRIDLYRNLYIVVPIIALSFLAYFFGSFIITFIRAYRLSQPLLQAQKIVFNQRNSKHHSADHPLDMLIGIVQNQKQVLDVSIRQSSMLRSSFLQQLTLGQITTEAEIQRYLVLLDTPDTHCNYQIVAGTLSYIHEEDDGSARTVLFEWLQAYFNDTLNMMTLIDPERFVILFLYDCDEETARAKIENKMQGLSAAISEKFTHPIYLSLSEIFASLLLAPKAYKEASETLAIFPSMQKNTMWSWTLTSDNQSNTLYYSSALERNIINHIYQGNEEDAENQLNIILDENLHKRNISIGAYYQLIFSLKSFVYKLQQEFSPSADTEAQEKLDISPCLFSRDLNRILKTLRHIISYYCEIQKKQQAPVYSNAIQDAINIIERHYSSPDMSVPYIAQQIHLSDNYFSQLFKKETGETFSTYLENIRLNKAISLLQKDYKINDISRMCGYVAPKSFQRAFKRRFGITASEYRNELLQAQDI